MSEKAINASFPGAGSPLTTQLEGGEYSDLRMELEALAATTAE